MLHSAPEDKSLHCYNFSPSQLSIFLLILLISCCRNISATWTHCPSSNSTREVPIKQRDVAYLKLCWGDQTLLNQTNALLKLDMNFAAHLILDRALHWQVSLQQAYLLMHMLTWQLWKSLQSKTCPERLCTLLEMVLMENTNFEIFLISRIIMGLASIRHSVNYFIFS